MKNLLKGMTSTPSNTLLVAFFLLASTVFAVSACEKQGPAEKAGESIDQSMESAKDSYKEGVEEVKDEVDDHS